MPWLEIINVKKKDNFYLFKINFYVFLDVKKKREE